MRDGSTLHNRATAPPEAARPCASAFGSIALLLQGGGALGAYQAGVYERLLEAGIEPTWIAGISIGAINSAIIAGNPRAERVAKLRSFWETVSNAGDGGVGEWWTSLLTGDTLRGWANQMAAGRVLSHGVPGFFEPRMPPPYLPMANRGATSYYDTSMLEGTLNSLVDFDRVNSREMRLSVGAVNVRTGNFAYFDNAVDTIAAKHIMASGALPPGFDAVEIDGEHYWDGGLVSNTPLDWVLSSHSGVDTLVLQVDLWSASGALPRDLTEVAVRMKEVQFSSRTRAATDKFRKLAELRTAFNELLAQMPPALAGTPQARLLAEASDEAVYNIVQLVYRSRNYEGQSKDFEFSRVTMNEHWRSGYDDAALTLSHPQILALPPVDKSPAIYDFLTSRHASAATHTLQEESHEPAR
ncbi:patatin-like phospholipase family protein [Massilia sp. CCM 8733]|uniref:Patatin-like phospholipase family protein n=1 Tax=Massilia mucilaginosa TaxID=2609282 RepID=A0ABX0P3M8_9BURK|nr:patatin-like phospholipase family protein [Massilia mucilaginosa]NHZ93643.1 patatin-like phospholipase family protein [Massilia mucilaginosa]